MTNQQKHKTFLMLFLVEFILFTVGAFGAAALDSMISNGWIALSFAMVIFLIIMPIIALFMIRLHKSIDFTDECFKKNFKIIKYNFKFNDFNHVKNYMEQNVFSVEDYYREETTLESGEPLYFYIKKFFFLSYKNIYVLVHLTNFDTMKGKEICKKVESKLKEEYEYDLRTAVFIMQCIDDFSDEYYKFYEEEIVVPASFIYSFLPVAFSLNEQLMYMGIKDTFVSQIYSNMKEEFPGIFNLTDSDIVDGCDKF